MCFTPDARGTKYYNSVPAGIEFQNDHECKARGQGYISVWARVHSTRVPNIIYHEGRGCKAYKDKRDRSLMAELEPIKGYNRTKTAMSQERLL